MRKKRKTSASDEAVARYWETHDATEVLDLAGRRATMIYEPPVRSISLRLPVPLLTKIQQVAAQMDIAYQALIKLWLAEKAREAR